MQPINYMLDVQQPLQMALAGYTQGQGIRANQQGMEDQRRLMEMQEMQFQQQQQAIQQQQARAQEMQMDMADYAETVRSGTVTPQTIVELTSKYPEMAESIQGNWAMLSEAQKTGKIDDYTRLISALDFDPAVAMGMIDERIIAAESAGDAQQVNLLKAVRSQAEIDPAAVKASLLPELALAMDPKQFEQYISTVNPPAPKMTEAVQTFNQMLELTGIDPDSPEAKRLAKLKLEGKADQGFGVRFDENGNIVYVGTGAGAPGVMEFAKAPTGMARVADPNSPTGTRLMAEPGSEAEAKQMAVVGNADLAISTLEDFINDPNVRNRYGLRSVGGRVPAAPGSLDATSQARVNQVKGQLFLTALASLRGTGPVTEVEGKAATAAQSILQDQNIRYQDAVDAANTLLDIARKARNRALGYEPWPPAGGATATPATGAQPSGPPTITTDEQFDALPSGTIYLDDEGTRRRKP
jgi:hypothetical protein